MSREIKYRVWDENKGEYCTDYENMVLYPDGTFQIETSWCIISGEFVVEQYTGLKDKNGESIYVGDIVKWKDGKGSVFYEEELTRYSVYSKHGGISPLVGKKTKRNLMYEVIGNIHKEEK